MKLRFLGQAYFSNCDRIETFPSEHTARFLGQNYIPYRPVMPAAKSQLGIRKYRGVVYGS